MVVEGLVAGVEGIELVLGGALLEHAYCHLYLAQRLQDRHEKIAIY